LGIAFKNVEHFNKALDLFNRALTLREENADAWYCKGLVYRELKQQQKEFEAYTKALEYNRYHAEALYNTACIYALRSDNDNALVYLAKASTLSSELREEAKTDKDFENLWQNIHFKIITA